ncbi:MAG: type VI secretion system needle protein Hcp [Prevotellaceae bacterium]|nr:type VI secretion system needle protein Hcp [Prevotellaceae bacterium]
MYSFLHPDAYLEVYLYVQNEEYEIADFAMEFNQSIDFRGQPQSEVNGGILCVTLNQIPKESVNQWMLRSQQKESGRIAFQTGNSNSPLEILFKDAYCVYYEKRISGDGKGVQTLLHISPAELTLNSIKFNNFWP